MCPVGSLLTNILSLAAPLKYQDVAIESIEFRSFEVGNWVWRWYPPKAGLKLGLGWTGPYLVIDIISDMTCAVQKSPQSPIVNVHKDHLKLYKGRDNPESWLDTVQDIPDILESDEDDSGPEFTPVGNDEQFQQTRRGRVVKPRKIYSP